MSVQEKLNDGHIRLALLAHKGKDAHLNSWTTESFTGKADNYASTILNIRLEFQQLGHKHKASYVAKLSPDSEDDISLETSYADFTKDSGFYQRILPVLSSILRECGIEDIRVPRCLFSSLEKGKELMILEDLRERTFRMHDRRRSLDVHHTTLILQELAKLHASSYILQHRDPSVDLKDRYPDLLRVERKYRIFLDEGISQSVENALRVLRRYGGYEKAEQWIENNETSCFDVLYEELTRASTFDVVCQGDCWNNNFLFRYDENNDPIEVMILDFQDLRKSSLATELNELMYTSLDGQTRKTHMDFFLVSYHETFKRVLEASGTPMAFSLQELREELKKNLMMGLLTGILTVPWMVNGDEGIQEYEGPYDDEERIEAFKNELERKTCQMLDSSPSLRRRYFSIFDDMIEAGVM